MKHDIMWIDFINKEVLFLKENRSSLEEIKCGYRKEEHGYRCLMCDTMFCEDEVYPIDGHFLTAKAAVKYHIEQQHGGCFEQLLELDKKDNSLTEVQKVLFRYIREGKSDKEIANLTNTSASTIRHQRFVFKEKAKQARIYLALYELAMENKDDHFLHIHATAKQVDDRFIATEKEEQQVLDTMFLTLHPLKLKQFPVKEKKKIIVLRTIVKQLDPNKRYQEKELNALLKDIYEDYVTIRRYLIEYGYLDRTKDCKEYWVKT